MLTRHVSTGRTPLLPSPLAFVVMVVVAVGAAWKWVLEPDDALRWLRVMAILPGLWVVFEFFLRSANRRVGVDEPSDEARTAVRGYFRSVASLVVVVLGTTLAASLWLSLAATYGLADPADLTVVLNLIRAGVLIVFGNMLPKVLTPLALLPPGSAGRQQAARRYLGRAFVLGGAVLAITTLSAPPDTVTRIRAWVSIGCILTTVLAIVWMNLGPRSREA